MALRAGEWVEVRSKEEILATLDARGRLDNQPFMPEMLEYCGRRFRVWTRAHKTCDTVNRTGGRRMQATVHLQELRCSGAAHGGCEAACLLFWKEAWLKRVSGPTPAAADAARPAVASPTPNGCTERALNDATRIAADGGSAPVYSCQATLLPESSSPLPWWDFRQYLEDWTSGNVPFTRLLAGAIYALYHGLVVWTRRYSWRGYRALVLLYDGAQKLRGGPPYPRRTGSIPTGQETPARTLDLLPGELVRVRPLAEILATLDERNRNRGMYFDAEEVPFCGKEFRVRSRVKRIVDERSGKMITLHGGNVILDNVWCQGRYSDRRMLCPRAIYPFWREVWLERVERDRAGS